MDAASPAVSAWRQTGSSWVSEWGGSVLPILGAENITPGIILILGKHRSFPEPAGGGDSEEVPNG